MLAPTMARAAPYAAMVMDARTGEVLHSSNADTRLHPASLTKMMTLYIAFEAIKNGEISLDTKVRISANAANEPPSKLGLKAGQRIEFRHLIRSAAIRSGNDTATAIGEALSGSEAAFAERMTRTAKALGLNSTTFKNAHGLTAPGHLSTARDMTNLGRRLLFDYPQYYNLFSRKSEVAAGKQIHNTNRRLLSDYAGADGIKTGYTNAAGFNLVASAVRGDKRIIATVFGGRSTATRNAKVAELLDLGFRLAPSNAPTRAPAAAQYVGNPTGASGAAGKIVRVEMAPARSLRPAARPGSSAVTAVVAQVASAAGSVDVTRGEPQALVVAAAPVPPPRPSDLANASPDGVPGALELEVVTRVSTSGGRHYGINVGKYASKYEAESVLLKTALVEVATLDEALRKVVNRPGGYEANFVGMTEDMAALACRRLEARKISCTTLSPG